MKRIILRGLILSALLLLASCAQLTKFFTGPSLRYDGLYQSVDKLGEGEHTYWKYLRFFPDGGVISVSSTGEPQQLKRWFDRRAEHAAQAEDVVQNGVEIAFSATSNYGTVDYAGRIEGDRLHLRTYSHINQHRAEHVYRFVAW